MLKFDQKKLSDAIKASRTRKKMKRQFSAITPEGEKHGLEWLETVPGKTFELYFPNITREELRLNEKGEPVIDEDGLEVIDTVADIEIYRKHQLKRPGEKGLEFTGEKRCIAGIHYTDDDGNVILDGKCPLCNARYEQELALANKMIEQDCAKIGLDPKADAKNPQVREIMKTYLQKTLISKSAEYVLVPFYYIETESIKGKNGKMTKQPIFQKDDEGNVITLEDGTPLPVFHRYIRRMALNTYNKMLETAEQMEYDAWGNRWSIKFGEGSKMNAGKEMLLVCLGGPKTDKVKKIYDYFDSDAKVNMTPDIIRESVYEAQINTKEELQDVAARISEPTIKALALLKTEETMAEETADDMNADLADMGIEVE